MKIDLEQVFSFPIQHVIKAERHRIDNYRDFPSMGIEDIIERTDSDERFTFKSRVSSTDGVPPALEKLVPRGLRTMIYHSHFHYGENREAFEVYPEEYRNRMLISGSTWYLPQSEQETIRRFNAKVTVNIPIAAKLAAEQLRQSYIKSLEDDRKSLDEALAILSE